MSFVKEYGLPLAGAGVVGLGLVLLYRKRAQPAGMTSRLLAPAGMTSSPLIPAPGSNHPIVKSVFSAVDNAQATTTVPLPPPPPNKPAPSVQIQNAIKDAAKTIETVTSAVDRLAIVSAAAEARAAQLKSGDYVYVVAPGDSIDGVTRRFGIPLDSGMPNTSTMLAASQISKTPSVEYQPQVIQTPGGPQTITVPVTKVDQSDPRYPLYAKITQRRIDPGDRLILPAISVDAGPSPTASGQIAPADPSEKIRA